MFAAARLAARRIDGRVDVLALEDALGVARPDCRRSGAGHAHARLCADTVVILA